MVQNGNVIGFFLGICCLGPLISVFSFFAARFFARRLVDSLKVLALGALIVAIAHYSHHFAFWIGLGWATGMIWVYLIRRGRKNSNIERRMK
jgi:hypothetical protein